MFNFIYCQNIFQHLVLAVDPKNAFALDNKSAAYLYLNDYEKCIEFADLALAVDPKNRNALK